MADATTRRCPRCERQTDAANCCGVDLRARRRAWHMDRAKIQLVHVLKARKGLDDETYYLRLGALGATSCKQLSRSDFRRFLAGLVALPDSPLWQSRPTRCARG